MGKYSIILLVTSQFTTIHSLCILYNYILCTFRIKTCFNFSSTFAGDNFVRTSGDAMQFAKRQSKVFFLHYF